MPIPWDKVILHGPQVLDVAKTLYGKWQSRPKPPEPEAAGTESLELQLKTLRSRLKTLEEAGEKQAALATELAEQNQALTVGVTAMKEQIERLRHEAEGAATAHDEIERRLHQTYDRLQQAEAAHSSLNKKITLALIASITALASSAAALAFMLQQ